MYLFSIICVILDEDIFVFPDNHLPEYRGVAYDVAVKHANSNDQGKNFLMIISKNVCMCLLILRKVALLYVRKTV